MMNADTNVRGRVRRFSVDRVLVLHDLPAGKQDEEEEDSQRRSSVCSQ